MQILGRFEAAEFLKLFREMAFRSQLDHCWIMLGHAHSYAYAIGDPINEMKCFTLTRTASP